VSYKILED